MNIYLTINSSVPSCSLIKARIESESWSKGSKETLKFLFSCLLHPEDPGFSFAGGTIWIGRDIKDYRD